MPFLFFTSLEPSETYLYSKKGQWEVYLAKNKKFSWFKRSNKVMFSWKNSKKLLKMMLLSLFLKRVFYSCEDIVCTCDGLADPRSIETVDNEIIYVSTINRAWRGFKSLNLRDTLTWPSTTQFDNCLLTISA